MIFSFITFLGQRKYWDSLYCYISGLALFLDYNSHSELWGREIQPSRGRKRNYNEVLVESDLRHLHEQGGRGDGDRLLMAREGKVVSGCRKCSWSVRKHGQRGLCSRSLQLQHHFCTTALQTSETP